MSILQWVNTAIVGLGIPTIVLVLIFIGRKLQVLDTVQNEINDNLRPDLKDVRERFATLEGKTANMFAANSPISLTDGGQKFLEESGLKKYIDDHAEQLGSACSEQKDLNTPYDVQQAVFELFDGYEFPQEVEDEIKTYAFKQGLNFDVARRIGAIYFRNICLSDMGFKPEDLDGNI